MYLGCNQDIISGNVAYNESTHHVMQLITFCYMSKITASESVRIFEDDKKRIATIIAASSYLRFPCEVVSKALDALQKTKTEKST